MRFLMNTPVDRSKSGAVTVYHWRWIDNKEKLGQSTERGIVLVGGEL